jgi:hypothetical protein
LGGLFVPNDQRVMVNVFFEDFQDVNARCLVEAEKGERVFRFSTEWLFLEMDLVFRK